MSELIINNSSEQKLFFIKETSSLSFELSEEAKNNLSDKSKPLELIGIIQRCDTLNKNGRIYSRDILLTEIERYKQNFVAQGCAFGELDHVDEPLVHAKNACILFKDIWVKGNDVYGKIRVLNNLNGDIVRSMLEAGGRPGISSRAVGSLRQGYHQGQNVNFVNEDLQIVCWDIVTDPSTPGAYMGLNEVRELKQSELQALNEYNLRNNIVRKQHVNKNYTGLHKLIDEILL